MTDEWQRLAQHFHKVRGTQFTRGACPTGMDEHYGSIDKAGPR